MNIENSITELSRFGFCVLPSQLPTRAIEACRQAFWPVLTNHLQQHHDNPNRGPHRHFLPMPFSPPCFSPDLFFNPGLLAIVHRAMDDRIVADQWGCDVPLLGSNHQELHADFQRPLFAEHSDLPLPPYMLVASFGLTPIATADGPIEIAPGTHRMPRREAIRAVQLGEIPLRPITLATGDVLLRHPWALHRGTPNTTGNPRALASIRYVRRWYTDNSREVNPILHAVWASLTPQQQQLLRFPVET